MSLAMNPTVRSAIRIPVPEAAVATALSAREPISEFGIHGVEEEVKRRRRRGKMRDYVLTMNYTKRKKEN